jgi:hypothetical protein
MSRHLSDSKVTFSLQSATYVSMSIKASRMLLWKSLRNWVILGQQLMSVLSTRNKDSVCEIVLSVWSKASPG